MKKCNSCNLTKSDDSFNKSSKKVDGLSNKCKDCNKSYLKEHYAKNKKYYTDKRCRTSASYREEFYEFMKDKSCVNCGNSDIRVLEFDHISDKSFNISTKVGSMPLKSLMQEIEKCDILCANCHRIKTSIQFGWYKAFLD